MNFDTSNPQTVHDGQTGGTGGPGGPGEPPTPSQPNAPAPFSVEDLANEVREERIKMFVGMTGGVGLPGTIEVNDKGEVVSEVSPEDEAALVELTHDNIDKMNLVEITVLIVKKSTELTATLDKANAHNAIRGYTIGCALLRGKYLIEKNNVKNGFSIWMQENLDRRTLSKRTCQKYMDLARIGDVLDYLPLGCEKLAALSPILKQMDGLDPRHSIRDFIEKLGINLGDCPDVESMRFEIGVGMGMAKLAHHGFKNIPKDLVYKFMECGFELNKKDFDAMKVAMASGGSAIKYLEKVIETNKRPGATHNAGASTPPKNLMAQAQEIRDTVAKLLGAPTISGDIKVDRIDALIKDLVDLKARLESSAGPITDTSTMQAQPETGSSIVPAAATDTNNKASAGE